MFSNARSSLTDSLLQHSHFAPVTLAKQKLENAMQQEQYEILHIERKLRHLKNKVNTKTKALKIYSQIKDNEWSNRTTASRLYDLNHSQYIQAKEHYQAAVAIYVDAHEKIANLNDRISLYTERLKTLKDNLAELQKESKLQILKFNYTYS